MTEKTKKSINRKNISIKTRVRRDEPGQIHDD